MQPRDAKCAARTAVANSATAVSAGSLATAKRVEEAKPVRSCCFASGEEGPTSQSFEAGAAIAEWLLVHPVHLCHFLALHYQRFSSNSQTTAAVGFLGSNPSFAATTATIGMLLGHAGRG